MLPLFGLYELGGLLLRWMPATTGSPTSTDESNTL
jgi:hypothetical protein